MSSTALKVAVQVNSKGTRLAALTRDQQKRIDQACAPDLDLHWLPPVVRRSCGSAGLTITSAIFLFVGGVVFSAVLKPFVGSVAQEAGKDFWSLVKKLICKIRKSQSREAYSVSGKAYVVLELGEDVVLVRFVLPCIREKEKGVEKTLRQEMDRQLEELAEAWDDIMADIKKFHIGERRLLKKRLSVMSGSGEEEAAVHVIYRVEGKLMMSPHAASDFLFRG